MKRNHYESDDDFETRQFKRRRSITWGVIAGALGTIAAVVMALDVIFGWGEKLDKVLTLPEKVEKLSDVVWADHQALVSLEIKENMQQLETPKERDELSELYTNAVPIVALVNTNNTP